MDRNKIIEERRLTLAQVLCSGKRSGRNHFDYHRNPDSGIYKIISLDVILILMEKGLITRRHFHEKEFKQLFHSLQATFGIVLITKKIRGSSKKFDALKKILITGKEAYDNAHLFCNEEYIVHHNKNKWRKVNESIRRQIINRPETDGRAKRRPITRNRP